MGQKDPIKWLADVLLAHFEDYYRFMEQERSLLDSIGSYKSVLIINQNFFLKDRK